MQRELEMNPSTQRPRRIELVAMGKVADSGETTETLSGRSAVLWKLNMKKPYKLCVCGGRDFDDRDFLFAKLDFLTSKIRGKRPIIVITGGQTGADFLAGEWAYANKYSVVRYHADWNKHGKAAGPIRNAEMLDTEKPDVLIAFSGGKGTADCIRQAKERNIPVREVRDEK